MSNIRIDKLKTLKKWTPVLENMGVQGEERLDWMSEYAEFHSINENAYANASIAGMGAVTSAQPGQFVGGTLPTSGYANANIGSGDLGQNLLPVAMKIAAQTIGLDLVAVKPTPGPKIDLLFIDFQYDDVDLNEGRPQIFKVKASEAVAVATAIRATLASMNVVETVGGISKRLYGSIDGTDVNGTAFTTTPPTAKTNMVEFLGFSRIDGLPILRAYRQYNANGNFSGSAGMQTYVFDAAANTFGPTATMALAITAINDVDVTGVEVSLVSAMEDHIPGFVTNWTGKNTSGDFPMDRYQDDTHYAGVIGPKVSSKTVTVGTIEVSSALRRTEIEDIKANTGLDIVQKMESVLVNELSQTISKQIVSKIFEMGDLNRQSAPAFGGTATITGQTIFDLDTNYVATGPGGETTHAVQRKLITKIVHASNFLATEGRVGPAQFLVTNGGLGAALMDVAGYTVNPMKSKMNGTGQLYPAGQIGDITIYVDPYMKYNDNRIVIGRKNNADQPGILFVPYLMAQSVSLISEATFAPRLLLRSRYAVAEMGWYPQKQYLTITVKDVNTYLN
jgi:hypothetical protein